MSEIGRCGPGFQAYMIHFYTHTTPRDGCVACEANGPMPSMTSTPENPITAEEAANPFALIETITLRPAVDPPNFNPGRDVDLMELWRGRRQ